MLGPKQYSLRFLSAEFLLVAIALALFRVAFMIRGVEGQLLVCLGLVFIGAALGGWLGSIWEGAKLALVTVAAMALLWTYLAGGTELVFHLVIDYLVGPLGIVLFVAYLTTRLIVVLFRRP